MLQGQGDRKLNIVGHGATSCNLDGGTKVAEDILIANPDPDPEGIYAVCGPPAIGAIQSRKNVKVDFAQFILVGFDACCGEINALKTGQEDATIAQSPSRWANSASSRPPLRCEDKRCHRHQGKRWPVQMRP